MTEAKEIYLTRSTKHIEHYFQRFITDNPPEILFVDQARNPSFYTMETSPYPLIKRVLQHEKNGLTSLTICKCHLCEVEINCLAAGLVAPTNKVRNLTFTSNSFSKSDSFTPLNWAPLLLVLQDPCNKIVSLNFAGSKMTEECVDYLVKGLKHAYSHVKYLNLRKTGIGHSGCLKVINTLNESFNEIEELVLSENEMRDKEFITLCRLVAFHQPAKKLRVFHCTGSKLTVESYFALAELLRHSNFLRKINLTESYDEFSGLGVRSLFGSFIFDTNQIHELIMADNNITDTTFSDVFSIFCSSSLVKLDLSGNNMRDSGCEKLALVLQKEWNNIQRLDLSQNFIRNNGFNSLTVALANKNCKLIELFLDENLRDENLQEWSYEEFIPVLQKTNLKLMRFNYTPHNSSIIRMLIRRNCAYKTIFPLLSLHHVKRIALKSSVRKLPLDLMRMVFNVLVV